MTRRMLTLLAAALASAFALAGPVYAKPVRWASQDDATTMDPHAFNHGMTMTVLQHIYEGLVRRDRNMQIEPALAQSWSRPEPTIWRFQLRPNAKFHDGSDLTAEDVVFSVRRVLSEPSDMKVFAASITEARVVDTLTVDLVTSFPNSALLQSLPEVRIMSKVWAEKNGAEAVADMRQRRENFATRNANGTGPFRLITREPSVRTVLQAHPAWWDNPVHNITEATLVIISSDPTRVAALLSGEVDFAYPIPLQDIERISRTSQFKVMQGPEIRTMFLAMDLERDELAYSSVKGRNPFKDRRVRQAFYQALDMDTLNARLMSGSVVPTGAMVAPSVNGADPALKHRAFPFDLAVAKRLMAEAGYAQGFELTLDCPNDRYVNDERVCQAITSMLARINVKATVNAMPASRFFPKIGSRDTSFNFFGFTPVNMDTYNTLSVMVHSPGSGQGQWNVGNYKNAEVDQLIKQSISETSDERRNAAMSRAMAIHREEIGHLPLYQQGIAWGMKQTVETPLQSDNRVNLMFFKVQ